ncbi:MAG: YraN family protein [Pyrinomonadaceae bacterium]
MTSILLKDNSVPSGMTRKVGDRGELLAAEYLVSQGYRLVMSNFSVPIGRSATGAQITGEIDVVAIDNGILCFIEVKTRMSDRFAGPLAAVDLRKQRQIIRAARAYRKVFGIAGLAFRYDVVTVLLTDPRKPVIEVVQGFWSESKFKKRSWSEEH